jgi:chaperonin cofactor prefoldin
MDKKERYTKELYVLQTQLMTFDKKKKIILSQISTTEKALDELDKTSEEKVYKIIGNILVKKEVNIVINELIEKKESMLTDLNKIEEQLENIMVKYKEIGAEFSGTTLFNSSDEYTLRNASENGSVFDMKKMMNKDN